MAKSIDATYKVVTPLFCAGTDPERPELRLSSFKGVLRFWWRALAWSRWNGDLEAIRTREEALFGSAGGGQSRLIMRLKPGDLPQTVSIDTALTISAEQQRVVGPGARYLGYGVMEAFDSRQKGRKAGQLTRACIRSPFEFTVQIRRPELSDDECALLKDALIAIGTLGGMGAKSRKGYGSLMLQSILVNGTEQQSLAHTIEDLGATIGALHADRSGDALPKFTALSKATRHVLVASGQRQPVELLDLVGRELVRFRSWGRHGKVLNGVESEKRFKDDHDLMKSPKRKSHPRRIAFGLPHNYGRDNNKVGPHDDLDRRASPLFIHIHRCSDGPVAVLSFLPARFLPDGTKILVGRDVVPPAPENELYRPIQDFLDRMLDENRRKEPFTTAVEVKS